MDCVKCSDMGLNSTIVHSSRGWTTTAYRYPFDDNLGNRHHHSIEITVRTHWCSEGHKFRSKEQYTCWCGWPNKKLND